jgi:hypothetical protein
MVPLVRDQLLKMISFSSLIGLPVRKGTVVSDAVHSLLTISDLLSSNQMLTYF